MGKPTPAAAVFALELRRAIERWERTNRETMSNRRLGKLTDPTDPERGRRRAQRHQSGKTAPTDASRRVYADVLDAPELLPDDEEEDMQSALMRDLRARVADPNATLTDILSLLGEKVA